MGVDSYSTRTSWGMGDFVMDDTTQEAAKVKSREAEPGDEVK
jgi:hypothetical protein